MKQPLQFFLDQIENLQSNGERHFPAGIFPAHRENKWIGYHRPDTTIFFSAIICFTLQSIAKYADADQQKMIKQICDNVIKNYPDFQNKDGLKTYNFWKTKPSRHFPNGHIFRRFEHFRIPDDVDDTSLIYLTTQPTETELAWLKDKLIQHANGGNSRVRNTFPDYKDLYAYSTWFGKKMYVEFDACVLSNLMYCIYHYNLPLTYYDEDTLYYIRSIIETDRHIKAPFRSAHQYPRTPLIIYHVTRLLVAFEPAPLRTIRGRLIADAKMMLKASKHPMDKVIIASSLIRLGVLTERIPVENFTKKDFQGFYFFIAGLLTSYENPLLYKLAISPLFHMRWICEAHCWTLLAEYETLWNNAEQNQR
ncbi:hypothetical protein [Dyadobacter psychrophilus]|uniref:Uncharacterized protein n=1 Tax=Dyadobacter psychrophilus TaxID=651661 RepID=A0A1T5CA77_9BACT|nr:hypothetical protein [Dyadobacter psychrophilus]SKB56256.1 hypothetical protein SAMN05660293_01034 [Dyadobacter psychrophilus]